MTGILFILMAGTLWGISGVCGDALIRTYGVSGFLLAEIRLMIGGTALTLWGLSRHPEEMKALFSRPRDILELLAFGLLGMTFNQVSYMMAIAYSNAGVATVLQYLGPVFLLLFICVREKRLPEGGESFSLLLALAGTVLLATGGDLRTLSISPPGLTAGLLAASAVVTYNITAHDLVLKYHPGTITGPAMLTGGILFSLVHQWKGASVLWTVSAFWPLVGLIVGGSIVAYTLYLLGLRRTGPVAASLLLCIEPVSAVVMAALFLHIPFTVPGLVGMGLILGAVIVLALSKKGRHGKKRTA